jgi:hypothetical protein
VYMKLLCYCREFLARPHPQVGRPGTTSPRGPRCHFLVANDSSDSEIMVPLRSGSQHQPMTVPNDGPGTKIVQGWPKLRDLARHFD